MKCPKCQHENSEDARFCNGCGHNLTILSELSPPNLSFDEKIDKIQRYLPKGLTNKILSNRDKIEGERKHVTVMFCDMEGFTPLVERFGPEDAYSVMDQVYEILIHKVREYDGTVNEMTGDGIMALFGAPIALEDAPQRALRSSLAIHREMAQFGDKLKENKPGIGPLKMRIGIHTGPVVVGTLGNDLRVEFKAVGDTVNLASRMEGIAEPGTTYVTKETFQFTRSLFQFEPLGEREVKGREKTVSVYKLLSAKEDVYRPRLGSERMIYSEMVGRDRELDKLEFQVVKAINGEGSIVNIIGEAGIGKSRLVAELKTREVVKRVTLLEGRAISMGRNLPFHPIIDLLKQWARIREDDTEAKAFERLETAIRNVCPEDFYEVLPFVATLMGMKLSGKYAEKVKGIEGEALEKLILKNVRDLLIKATDLTPLVIVAEDLHWADTSSIDLMGSLFRLAERQRILFVNVFRPGHSDTVDRIAETVREILPAYYVEIVLQPLDGRMSETLINNMLNLRGLHHPIIDQIIERADGNPFFIEEVVRSLIDEGAVVLVDGSYQVTEKIDRTAIPHTINDVLMARIDRLEEKTRELVKIASVIGRNFFHRILAEVARTIEDIDNKLSYLKEIQLIRERRRLEELEYLFKHALAQEVAYESILLKKRKELHLKVADSIEKVFRERLHEFYGMLAFHYSRGEDEEKAEEYLIKAGEEALKASASSEALHFYQEALNLYQERYGDDADSELVAMLEKNIALAFFNRGQHVEAIEYFDKALAYYGEKVPKHPILMILKFLRCFLGFLISLYLPFLKFKRVPTQKDREVIDLSGKKLEALNDIDAKRCFIECIYFAKGLTDFDLTKIEKGFAIFAGSGSLFSWTGISFRLSRKVLEFCKNKINEDDVKSKLMYNHWATTHNWLAGNWGEVYYDDNLVNQNLSAGELFNSLSYAYTNATISSEKGRFNEAKKIIDGQSEIVDDYDYDFARVQKFERNTKILMKWRKLHDALAEAEQSIAFSKKTGHNSVAFSSYSDKASIQTMMRDIDGAEESIRRAKEYLSEAEAAVPYFLSSFLFSKFIFSLYRLEESTKSGKESELAENRKNALRSGKKLAKVSRKVATVRTEALRLMGTYYWLIGKQKKALRWWSKSTEEGERIGARVELSRTYFEVGKRLTEPKSKFKALNGIKAEEYLEKARSMFQEMDLQWDLDQLDRIGLYG